MKLTAARARELLAYCQKTGVITWRVAKSPRAPAGSVAGYVQDADWHRKIRIDGRLYSASHLAILLATGVMPVGAAGVKAQGMNWSDQSKRGQDFTRMAGKHAASEDGIKQSGLSGLREKWQQKPCTQGRVSNDCENPHNVV